MVIVVEFEEYFDKSVPNLITVDIALLAALPKAPSKYNPYKYPDIAKFRRNFVPLKFT